jgi:hypothetical protein
MKRTGSVEKLVSLRDAALGPTQRQQMGGDRSLGQPVPKDAPKRSLACTLLLVACAFGLVILLEVFVWKVPPADLPAVRDAHGTHCPLPTDRCPLTTAHHQLFFDVATFRRVPAAAQDNAAAMASIAIFLLPLVVIDQTVCTRMYADDGARWFLLHALGECTLCSRHGALC